MKNGHNKSKIMSVYHDEIEIEDMEYDEENGVYHYPCPCGDRFEIFKEDLINGEEVATCPSCSLVVRVIYDADMFHDEVQLKKLNELKIAKN